MNSAVQIVHFICAQRKSSQKASETSSKQRERRHEPELDVSQLNSFEITGPSWEQHHDC